MASSQIHRTWASLMTEWMTEKNKSMLAIFCLRSDTLGIAYTDYKNTLHKTRLVYSTLIKLVVLFFVVVEIEWDSWEILVNQIRLSYKKFNAIPCKYHGSSRLMARLTSTLWFATDAPHTVYCMQNYIQPACICLYENGSYILRIHVRFLLDLHMKLTQN